MDRFAYGPRSRRVRASDGKRKRSWLQLAGFGSLVIALLMLTSLASAAWLTDSGTVNVEVPNKTTSVVDATTAQGAFISYFGDSDTTFGASGTGTFNPFVRLQGSPTEQGYNTDGTTEFDTKVGTWTHAIKVSQIPQRPCPQASPTLTCFELFVDINESNSAKHIALNKVDLWFTDSATLSGYPFSATATTTEQYLFNGNILINDVNQGSGRGDLRYDIPINGPNAITLPPNCNYGNPLCNTYFVLYSQWGTGPSSTYNSEGGFEEWKVKVYPTPPDISVVKTPDSESTGAGTVSAGSNAVFTITVTNNGPITATGVTLTDVLPTIAGSGWTVGGADAASCSGTNPHAGGSTLTCNFGDIPFPGSRTITLTSPTTAADCTRSGTVTGDIDNTASVSATNEDSAQLANNSDHGDVHVVCAAIQILKESTKGTNPLVANAGAVFSVTGPGGYSASVTDNGSGDEDSTIGQVCISGLAPGTYTVNETTPPPGYGGAGQTNVSATAANGTDCGSSKPSTADSAVFTNPPLYDLQVNFADGGSGETSATIDCGALEPPDSTTAPAGWDTSSTYTGREAPQTITCTITVDP